ncbi:MAG: OPT/YSL family transporter [Candidatus Korobacteraceae bacterium]
MGGKEARKSGWASLSSRGTAPLKPTTGLSGPPANALSMFLGALIAFVLQKARPATAEKFVVPVSSGFIAGESLMGIAVALLHAAGKI